MCCAQLTENTGRKNSPKSRHLGTIPQLCRAISSQLGHVSTIGKKLVKQQYLLHISPQYGELRPTSGWDCFVSLGHPCNFQRVLHLGSITARHSSSGHEPNFAALNRGRHLYSAGRPSRWALADISSWKEVSIKYRQYFFWLEILTKTTDTLRQAAASNVRRAAGKQDHNMGNGLHVLMTAPTACVTDAITSRRGVITPVVLPCTGQPQQPLAAVS